MGSSLTGLLSPVKLNALFVQLFGPAITSSPFHLTGALRGPTVCVGCRGVALWRLLTRESKLLVVPISDYAYYLCHFASHA